VRDGPEPRHSRVVDFHAALQAHQPLTSRCRSAAFVCSMSCRFTKFRCCSGTDVDFRGVTGQNRAGDRTGDRHSIGHTHPLPCPPLTPSSGPHSSFLVAFKSNLELSRLRRLGREKFRQLVGTQTDAEYWPTWLKGDAAIK
jgi:hypothetical protein